MKKTFFILLSIIIFSSSAMADDVYFPTSTPNLYEFNYNASCIYATPKSGTSYNYYHCPNTGQYIYWYSVGFIKGTGGCYHQNFNWKSVPCSCPAGTRRGDDGTCVTTCPTGYKHPTNSPDVCVADCTVNKPTPTAAPLGYTLYVNVGSSSACQQKAVNDTYPLDDFKFSDFTDNRGCKYTACYINEFRKSDCDNPNNPNTSRPPSYIFRGVSASSAVCKNYIDGVTVLNYQTAPMYSNCKTNSSVYCYLKIGLDNNDTGFDFNDTNQTFSDGSLSPDDGGLFPNADDSVVKNDFNSTANSNVISTAMSDDLKTLLNNYNKNNENNEKNRKFDFDKRTSNDNANTDKITTKLNDLYSYSATDTSSADLGNANGLVSSLPDLNDSGLDGINFSVILSDNNLQNGVDSVYNNFYNKVHSALSSLFGSLNFGFIGTFNVPPTSFVDVPLPEITFLGTTLNGKLMDASFLNALNFSLLKLAFLIATLLWCLSYIFHKVF